MSDMQRILIAAGVLAALDGFAGATQREDDLTIVAMQLTE
jgi:hypothetical protein